LHHKSSSNEFGHELDLCAFLEFCKSARELEAREKFVASFQEGARSFENYSFLSFFQGAQKTSFVLLFGASTKRFLMLSWVKNLILIFFVVLGFQHFCFCLCVVWEIVGAIVFMFFC
jgi:hypothetical protein